MESRRVAKRHEMSKKFGQGPGGIISVPTLHRDARGNRLMAAPLSRERAG